MQKSFATQIRTRSLMLALPLCLAACAGTKVRNVVDTDPVASIVAPHTISVVVDNASAAPEKESRQAKQMADATQSVADLTRGLDDMLAKHQLTVVRAGQKSDLVLHCQVTDVRGGNQALRLVVGYGAGKAVLRTDVTLDDAAGHTLLSFETRSTTGASKGAGLGLMDASSALSTVEAGVTGVRGLKKDLPNEVTQTTEHVDSELGKYFTAHQWAYPVAATVAQNVAAR